MWQKQFNIEAWIEMAGWGDTFEKYTIHMIMWCIKEKQIGTLFVDSVVSKVFRIKDGGYYEK